MKTLIIIPAFNEQECIEDTLLDIRTHAPDMDYIVINDCSTDRTREILRQKKIPHIDLPINLGIGGGVQTGYRYAMENGYDIAIQFDGDGQHMAEYLHALIAPIENGEADVTIGSRFIRREGFQSTVLRRFGISFLSCLIHSLCGVKVYDVTSGMRAVNKNVIAYFAREYAQDYPEPEAILAASQYGARIQEIPVKMRERQGGVSSIKPLSSVYYMIKVSLALMLARLYYKKR